jgi:hypothetical protein
MTLSLLKILFHWEVDQELGKINIVSDLFIVRLDFKPKAKIGFWDNVCFYLAHISPDPIARGNQEIRLFASISFHILTWTLILP